MRRIMKSILIVEDEKDMQEIYKDMFAGQTKYEIDIEGGTMPALRRLAQKRYDMIILDIIMDPIPGDSFFVYLKSDIRTESIPVIIVSVLKEDTLENLKKIGNKVRFLQKPISKEKLFSTIEAAISK